MLMAAPNNMRWCEDDTVSLLSVLDDLNARGVRFALSEMLETKNQYNYILSEWLDAHANFHCFHMNVGYANSSYHRSYKESIEDEVLITNY